MSQEQLFASFILDRRAGIEIALPVEQVIEAIPISSPIQPLPASAAFLEGIMHLRHDVIPVINLKKRLSLPETGYGGDAKVAVIQYRAKRYGLLFDDIREVLRVPAQAFENLDRFLLTEDAVIVDLIKLEQGKRTLKLLDLQRLFPGGSGIEGALDQVEREAPVQRTYSRYVVFSCREQVYGIPVEDARELCFFADVDELFKSGIVEGALQLRGQTIPVLSSASLLGCGETPRQPDEDTRILVLQSGELCFGFIVDKVHQILVVADDEVMEIPGHHLPHLQGVCPCAKHHNIMLLNVMALIDGHVEKVKAMTRMRQQSNAGTDSSVSTARHIITEHCYLVFSIGKNYAIELKDVQEIIDCRDFMHIANGNGLVHGLINLRGRIVPVLRLRPFYNCPHQGEPGGEGKLIIGRANGNLVALLVDEIVTIYKQEQYHLTPSLRPELQAKKDTLDRLIEFVNGNGLKEHVLVVNVAHILRNHLQVADQEQAAPATATAEASGSVTLP